jgi:hypothetical protein
MLRFNQIGPLLTDLSNKVDSLSDQVKAIQQRLDKEIPSQLQEIMAQLQPMTADPNNLSETHTLEVHTTRMAADAVSNMSKAQEQNKQAKFIAA